MPLLAARRAPAVLSHEAIREAKGGGLPCAGAEARLAGGHGRRESAQDAASFGWRRWGPSRLRCLSRRRGRSRSKRLLVLWLDLDVEVEGEWHGSGGERRSPRPVAATPV